MRSLRSPRVADDTSAAVARARVAHLIGPTRPSGNRTAADAADLDDDGAGGLDASGSGGPGTSSSRGLDARGPGDLGARGSGQPGARDGAQWLDAVEGSATPQETPDGSGEARLGLLRLGLERAHVVVVVIVVVLGLAGGAIFWWLSKPEVVPLEPEIVATGTPVSTDDSAANGEASAPAASDGSGASGGASAPAAEDGAADAADGATGSDTGASGAGARDAGALLVVHVAGLVAKPGVVELPAGSRVIDAIEAAGGATADADLALLNLARLLSDGEQVLVTAEPPPAPPAGLPDAGAGGTSGTGTEPAGPVNLNTATAAELDMLPGIGPKLAERILQWRDENGRFSTIDELREIPGIGEQRFAELEPLVTV